MATMREQLEQARLRRRRALRKALGVAGVCVAVAATGLGFKTLKHDPSPYDAAATRASPLLACAGDATSTDVGRVAVDDGAIPAHAARRGMESRFRAFDQRRKARRDV